MALASGVFRFVATPALASGISRRLVAPHGRHQLPVSRAFPRRAVSTCDLSDKHGDAAEVLDPLFRAYGGNVAFHGQIQTVKCFEDNSLVKKQLEAPGHGRVLVVDGGGSTRRSLLGDENAALGIKNGWVGMVVYGAIRDSQAIAGMPFGVRAVATTPRKTEKKDRGDVGVVVKFAGVTMKPGQWCYVDEDGILVSEKELTL